jgi:hypothetical protein
MDSYFDTEYPGAGVFLALIAGAIAVAVFGLVSADSMSEAAWSILPVALAATFVALHLRPLNRKEIYELAKKRRAQAIEAYYQFSGVELKANKTLKKAMHAQGRFYEADVRLVNFPAAAAALVKGKKHEWILIGFEKNQRVRLLWLNKGPDRTEVAPRIPPEAFRGALNGEYTTVLMAHNHPNGGLQPSDQDLRSARYWARELLPQGRNLVEFVCARGRFRKYHHVVSEKFRPVDTIVVALTSANGKSYVRNLGLHLERIFPASRPSFFN